MKQRYKYRIYPTPTQRVLLAQLFGCSRVAWNNALAFCRDEYAEGCKYSGFVSLSKRFTALKKTEAYSWLADVAAVPLQQSLKDLDIAFRNFFDSVRGKRKGPKVRMPRFKKRSNAQSARFVGSAFKREPKAQAYQGRVAQSEVESRATV